MRNKSILLTHSCGHKEWHRYDGYRWQGEKACRYFDFMRDLPCSSCRVDMYNSMEGFAELVGTPSSIAYGGQCRDELLRAIRFELFEFDLDFSLYEDDLTADDGELWTYKQVLDYVRSVSDPRILIELAKDMTTEEAINAILNLAKAEDSDVS